MPNGRALEIMPRLIKERDWRVGAEIGVARGNHLRIMLDENPGLVMFAVDSWVSIPGSASERWPHNFHSYEVKRLSNLFNYRGRIHVIHAASIEAAKYIADGSLDFVFIDAEHDKNSVIQDIKAWSTKVRSGGGILGDDAHFDSVSAGCEAALSSYKVHENVIWEAT